MRLATAMTAAHPGGLQGPPAWVQVLRKLKMLLPIYSGRWEAASHGLTLFLTHCSRSVRCCLCFTAAEGGIMEKLP